MMGEKIKILFVDDEQNVLKALARIFVESNYTILAASSGREGLNTLEQEDVQIVISDYRMPEMDGIKFLKEVCQRWPDTVRIVLSGYAETAVIVAAINEGQIYKFIPKPWNEEELKITISNAVERYLLIKKNRELAFELKIKNEELERLNNQLIRALREKSYSLEFTDNILTLYQRLYNSLPDGICGIDFDNEVMLCNTKWDEIFEKTWRISGNNIMDVIPEDIKEFIEKVKIDINATKEMEIHGIHGRLIGRLAESTGPKKSIVLMFIPYQADPG